MRFAIAVALVFFMALAVGCGDDADNLAATFGQEHRTTEAQRLLNQFGELQRHFTEAGVQGLLDYVDSGRPVLLLQLMSVTDHEAFAQYEESAAALWASVGARAGFSSQMFDQLVGDRPFNYTRAIEFPGVSVLLSTMDTPAFTDLMNQLALASDDHAWVLGEETVLPLQPGGSYFDPALQQLDGDQARNLLAGAIGDSSGSAQDGFGTDPEVLVDMLVSDAPGPFWMVNLIDFYEQANFPDGRETELTGRDANALYGNAIVPTLLRYNSVPDLVMPVNVILTREVAQWEQVAIVRYASRDAFLRAFALNPLAGEALVYKRAGVENTLVYASEVPGTVLPAPQNGPLYEYRYCEVLLFYPELEGLRADVFNSIPLSTCPQDLWDALDAEAIASAYGAEGAALNGIRFWVLDLIQSMVPPGPAVTETFGGIPMRLAASVVLAGAGIGEAPPYQVNRVSRDTVFTYVAGRQVYELEDPGGTRYRMQSFTQGIDSGQQLVDLQRLEQRLTLPAGWSFSVEVMEEDFELRTVDGIAEVITDDFGNTYQRVP